MKLVSANFLEATMIPQLNTCDGGDKSPQLSWSEFPAETKSFALSCIDLDASGDNWYHWLVVNISRDVNAFEQSANVGQRGIEIENSFHRMAYGGPCPPSGEHKYVFTIYALDIESLIGVTKEGFVNIANLQSLDKAELSGVYSRQI